MTRGGGTVPLAGPRREARSLIDSRKCEIGGSSGIHAKRTAHLKSHIAAAESWALVAPEADESCLDRFIERGVRLPADYRPEACVFHAERNAPQVTHFEHLAECRDKRRTQHEQ